MDVLAVIVFALGAMLIGLKVVLQLYREYATIRERIVNTETRAKVDVMQAATAKSTMHGTLIVHGLKPDGTVDYTFIPASGDLPIKVNDIEAGIAHRIAVDIVSESRKRFGGTEIKLMPGNEWPSQKEWQLAIDYLKKIGLIFTERNGTFVKRGDLDALMVDLAVKQLPKRNPPTAVAG